MFIKATLVYGLGMDLRNVTKFVQPLSALLISIWHLDIVVEDFWIRFEKRQGSLCQTILNLSLFVWCGPFAILSGVFSLVRKIAYNMIMLTLRSVYLLIRLMLFPFLGDLKLICMVLIVIIFYWRAPALLGSFMPTINNLTNFDSMGMELLSNLMNML